jgi:magnesium chelatase family protein
VNSDVPGPVLRRDHPLDPDCQKILDGKYTDGQLTARGLDRVVRLAWTLADLDGLDQPTKDLTNEAYQLRSGAPLTRLADARSIRNDAA